MVARRFGVGSCRPHLIEVIVSFEEIELSADAVRIIQVPFEVSPRDLIEVGSIADVYHLNLRPANYALRFECFPPYTDGTISKIRLFFVESASSSFCVLRADAELSIPNELRLAASVHLPLVRSARVVGWHC
jgi:hypothetical protein